MNTASKSRFGKTLPLLFVLTAALSLSAATVRYVNVSSTNPVPPFIDWSTAATNIQDAVDAAEVGDEIVVTNGVYQTGAREVYGMSNRVAVTIPVTVRSVNGPAVTQIVGHRDPISANGPAAVRCVFLANGAVLTGFTLTNGATQTSGETYEYENKGGGGVWCDGQNAVVSNCVLTGNSAYYGGGAYSQWATLDNCVLTGNAASRGGGAWNGTLNNCTITGNSADFGGGVYYGRLKNCIVCYNSARFNGANYFDDSDNYSAGTSFNYCYTTPLPEGTGNLAEEPQLASAWRLSANSPCIGRGSADFVSGVDVDGEPWGNPPSIGCDEFWSGSVTGALSVAVVATYTNVSMGFGVDFQAVIGGRVSASRWDFGDGVVVSNRPWVSHRWAAAGDYVVELRAYNETYPAGVTATVMVRVLGQPNHFVALTSANPVPPYSSWATAARNIQDAVDAVSLPGAVVWVSNGVYQTGAREVYGMSNRLAVTKPVMVRSVNGPAATQILGDRDPVWGNGPMAVRCVYLTDGAVLTGFTLTGGATAGSFGESIGSGGGVWCEGLSAVLSNCVLTGNSAYYRGGGTYGGTLNNCTLTGNSALTDGGAYGGTLNNCTLTGNSAGYDGGGISYGTVNNCVLTANSAQYGGGAFHCTLNNCVLVANSAGYGAGVYYCTLNNCTLTGNSANYRAGGAYNGRLNNCIICYNRANVEGANYLFAVLDYCWATPQPPGMGNLANDPLFSNTNGWTNLRLQANSPCVNAGDNAYAPGPTDIDGRPRIVGGTVDIGAYEFQSPGQGEFIGWLQQYGLPTDGSADFTDPDGDRANNWQEWQCDTIPTNALSALRLLTPQTDGTNLVVTWQSVANKTYFLERSTGLDTNAPFVPVASNLVGQAGTTTFTDTNAASSGPRFYRVGVQ